MPSPTQFVTFMSWGMTDLEPVSMSWGMTDAELHVVRHLVPEHFVPKLTIAKPPDHLLRLLLSARSKPEIAAPQLS